jgi:hypothetical protein
MNREIEVTEMEFFFEKRLMGNSTKRSLWLLLLCTSALVVNAQQTGPSNAPASAPGYGSASNTANAPVTPNVSRNSPGIPLQLNGQSSPGEVNLFVSSEGQTTIFLLPTSSLPKVQYTITAVGFPVTVTLKDKEPATKGVASSSVSSYLGTDTTNPPSAGASPSPSPSQSPGNLLSPSPTPAPGASIIPFILSVDVLPQPGDQYTGSLLVTATGYSPLSWKVNIKPANGNLVLDLPSVSRTLTLSPWGTESDSININVREKTGRVRLEGLSASLVQIVKSPSQGFDLKRNVDFSFNGENIPDFTQSPLSQPNQSRSIAANNGLAAIGLRLHDLSAGEYSVVVRFQSLNSSNDDAKLTLNLQVRHHWLWPILLLILAVILSFVATKVISSLRQRYNFMERIEDLKPNWLDHEPRLLPVVWTQAILRQSQELSDRFWLTGEDQIEKRVTHAEDMVKVLDKIRILRIDVQTSALRKYQKYRSLAKLNDIVLSLGTDFLDDAKLKEVDDSLTRLRQWLDENSMPYWLDLRTDIRLLLSEVDPDRFPDSFNLLNGIRGMNDVPQNLAEIEDCYALMKLLWERSDLAELKGLKLMQPVSSDSAQRIKKEAVYQKADLAAWNRLKDKKANLKIKMPDRDDLNPLETYTPIQFSVEPSGDESLANTYLYQHGLKFEWSFRFTTGTAAYTDQGEDDQSEATKKSQSIKQVMILNPITEEPEVVQYFPQAGKVTVSVKISCRKATNEPMDISANVTQKSDGEGNSTLAEAAKAEGARPETKEVIDISAAAPLTISKCKDFDWLRGLAHVEIGSFLIAAAAAVITGMTTFYLKNTGFGTASDYLTMFIWGVGIDQGKNFVQNLQAYSK